MSMFDQDNSTPAQQQQYLEQWVGEGKKYASVEELAKAHTYGEKFIEDLKNDNKSLRDEMVGMNSKITKTEDLLKAIQEQGNKAPEGTTSSLNKDAIADIVQKAIKENATASQQQANIASIEKTLLARFGDEAKAKQAVADKAAEAGVSVEELVMLGKKSPKLFEQAMGFSEHSRKEGVSTESSVNTAIMGKENGGERNKAFFDKMRKENRKLYWSQAIQQEIQNLAAAGKYF